MKKGTLACLHAFLCFAAQAQTSSKELGEKIFLAFKQDSINLVNNYRLKIKDLPAFFTSNNIDTNSNTFIIYRSKYPEITEKLLQKCGTIETDTLENHLSWKKAELSTVKLKNQLGEQVGDQEKSGTRLLEITFTSNGIGFLLLVETILAPDKLWKVGNSISLFAPSKEIID